MEFFAIYETRDGPIQFASRFWFTIGVGYFTETDK